MLLHSYLIKAEIKLLEDSIFTLKEKCDLCIFTKFLPLGGADPVSLTDCIIDILKHNVLLYSQWLYLLL